jgi:hypothetical protein
MVVVQADVLYADMAVKVNTCLDLRLLIALVEFADGCVISPYCPDY